MNIIDVEFLGPLQLQAGDVDGEWTLLADFSALVTSDVGTQTLTVPKGFVTDLASVPRLPGMYLLFGGKARKPAVLHDWLYTLHDGEREIADAVFFRAMAHDENLFTRTMMWLGVRVGGWAVWQRRKVPTLPPPEFPITQG